MLEPAVQDKGPAEGPVAKYTEPGGAPQAVTGGSSFASATTLPGSGHFTDTILGGEWVFYRVRLEWGQSLAFQTRVGGGTKWNDMIGIQTLFYNPIREQLAQDSFGVTDTERIYSGTSGDPFATRPVRYLNRDDARQEVADMLPGWYYIAVSAEGGEGMRTLAVDVSVTGTKEPGPVYAQNAQVTDSAPQQQGAPPANDTASVPPATKSTAGGDDDDKESAAFGGPTVWIGLPLALVLGAGLMFWVLRRRSGVPGSGPPTNQWTNRR
jgi:Ca-activated chloride channel family protein